MCVCVKTVLWQMTLPFLSSMGQYLQLLVLQKEKPLPLGLVPWWLEAKGWGVGFSLLVDRPKVLGLSIIGDCIVSVLYCRKSVMGLCFKGHGIAGVVTAGSGSGVVGLCKCVGSTASSPGLYDTLASTNWSLRFCGLL